MKSYVSSDPRNLLKNACYLAWLACGGPMGYGILQDRGNAVSAGEVWHNIKTNGDYPGAQTDFDKSYKHKDRLQLHADYVFGRMMKLDFEFDDTAIYYHDETYRPSYQGFAGKYPTPIILLNEARELMEMNNSEREDNSE